MKNKYKATPKTYASQPRRNGKVTARLAGLLARADVHVEEGELKSISTEPAHREAHVYHTGGLLRRTTFDPPVQVNAGGTLHLEGTGRVFIGNTEDPHNLREIGEARNITVDLASGRDSMALVQMDFAGLETRVMNYSIQAAAAEEIARRVDREIMGYALFGARYSPPRLLVVDSLAAVSDAANAQSVSLEELRESYQRFSEVAGYFSTPNFQIGPEERISRRKSKKDRKPHPESGKVVVLRKTRRTLLGIVVTDMRVGSGGFKRTAQLGITVQTPRRRRHGNK